MKSKVLRTYQRRTLVADALIASAYLAGTNTRRVRGALKALFAEGIGKDVVSRVWRRVKSGWDAWNARSLAEEPIVRLILDGTVVRVRLDRKATSISLLVVIGVRADRQKMCLQLGARLPKAHRADGLPTAAVIGEYIAKLEDGEVSFTKSLETCRPY